MEYNKEILKIDPHDETEKLCSFIQDEINRVYRRKGIVK